MAEAPSFGKTIFQYDWNYTGTEAYQALAKEVIQRTKRKDEKESKAKKTEAPEKQKLQRVGKPVHNIFSLPNKEPQNRAPVNVHKEEPAITEEAAPR